VAQQDYFSGAGAKFGQLAGSILSSKRRRKKRDAITALALSAFVETLGAKNQQLQQGLADSIADVKDNYADIFTNNKDLWDENATKRADLRLYEDEYSREDYLKNEAIKLFNSDKELRDLYGSNAWSRVKNFGEGSLPADEYKAAQDLFDDYKKLAEDNIKTYKDNPETSFRTFTQFNALAKQEYKAALDAVKNDPTKKGAIRAWWNKRWGTDKEGKPRFGMLKKAELELIRENAATNRKAQDSLTAGNSLYEENTEKDNKIYERIKAMRERYTGFRTNSELIKSETKQLKEKIETNDFTIENLERYLSLGGTPTTNIPKINEILANEIPNFVQVFTKVVAMRERKPEDVSFDPTDFLSPRELNIYDLGMGIERDEGVVYTPQEADRIRSGLVYSINIKEERDKKLWKMLDKIEGDFKVDETSGEDISTGQSSIFLTNIIRAATKLQNKYDMEENEALAEALKMQLQGIETGVGPKFNPSGWRKEYRQYTTSVVDYVDPDVALLPIMPETAVEIADNVNNSRWLQQRIYKDENNKSQTWKPAKEKMYIYDEDEGFKIIFRTRKNKKTEEYEWYPEIDFGRNDPYGYIP
jgi:hypothetical protein